MSYTFLSASFADEAHSCALVQTAEAGAVVLSEADTPAEWQDMLSHIDPVAFVPSVSLDDYRRAIQAHVDTTAQSRGYDSGVTCSSYVNSTNEIWAAEAADFVAWRDSVWGYAFTELDKVQNGQRAQPTVAQIVAELPAMIWPGS